MERITHDVLEQALEQTGRAPSVHNTQPWSWRTSDEGVELLADRSRQLSATDPAGRDLAMSCGAALETLRVTAAALGWTARVQHVPDPASADVLARVSFQPHPVTEEDRRLALAVQDRHTDRRELSSWEVPPQRVEHLSAIARDRGAFLTALTQAEADRVGVLIEEAARLQGDDATAQAEVLAAAAGNVPASSRLSDPAQDTGTPTSRFPAGTLEDVAKDPSPTEAVWLVLSTSSDDTLSWLRAGEALQAAWLWTTAERMSLLPFSQPTEVESVRRTVQEEVLLDRCCPQIVLRLGWPQASHPPVPRTDRQQRPSDLSSARPSTGV